MRKTAVFAAFLAAYAVGVVAQDAAVNRSQVVKRQAAQEAAAQQAASATTQVHPMNNALCSDVHPWNATDGASAVRPGFDNRGPYVDATFADGTVRRVRENGTTILKNGAPVAECRGPQMMQSPNPTPPELPVDPKLGRAWVERHDADLLAVIRKLVHDDENVLRTLTANEQQWAGDDVFKLAAYRMGVVSFYVTHQQ
jgi:hypothetical protein